MDVEIGRDRFEVVDGFFKRPRGWTFVEVADVSVDRDDNVYVFGRGNHPVMIFDKDGNFLDAWGEIGGEHYIGLPLPLRSAAGDLFGGVVAFRPRGAELAAFHALRNMIWVALGVGVVLALIAAALFIGGFIGNLVASKRRVPARPSVYATVQHRLEMERASRTTEP